jgi:23S rRNA (guanosine2251-2'-O)-methyltransferase
MAPSLNKLSHDQIASRRLAGEEIHRAPRFPIYVLLDNIRSMYNVGSIFRTSDGARIQELILTGFTPHPPRKEISKTALGAVDTVPWSYVKDPLEAVARLKREGVKICLVEQTDGSRPHTSVQPEEFPLCLLIGNELTGISSELVETADMAIEIPMFGAKQSLNAAVAYGIAVFEMIRILQQGPATSSHRTPG